MKNVGLHYINVAAESRAEGVKHRFTSIASLLVVALLAPAMNLYLYVIFKIK